MSTKLCDRNCPPEASAGLVLRHICRFADDQLDLSKSLMGISVPTCLDQPGRRGIKRAADLAQLTNVRLIDRAIAACTSQLIPEYAAMEIPRSTQSQYWLAVSIDSACLDVAVIRYAAGRLQMISTAGSTKIGVLSWQKRLLQFIVESTKRNRGVNLSKELRSLESLKIAIEQAMLQLILHDKAEVNVEFGGQRMRFEISRTLLDKLCSSYLKQLQQLCESVIDNAAIAKTQISRCLLYGDYSRLPVVTRIIHKELGDTVPVTPIDQASIACGVAAVRILDVVTHEGISPPQLCSAFDVGLSRSASEKINVAIPRLTSIPTKVSRLAKQLSVKSYSFEFFEMGGWDAETKSLGVCSFDNSELGRDVEIIVELTADGLLEVQFVDPKHKGLIQSASLPRASFPSGERSFWRQWIGEAVQDAEPNVLDSLPGT